MDDLRDALIDSYKAGTLIQVVYTRSIAERDQRNTLAAELTALHNEGAIDVIAGFTSLNNRPGSEVDFFLTRHVFEKILPQISASIQPVMACVHHLYAEAGHDGAAGMILDAYSSFCEKDPSHPKEALKEIERNPDLLPLLTPTIVAGSRIDTSHYLAETLRLAGHNSIEFRRSAVFTLGRIQWPKGSTPPASAYTALEKVVAVEDDDNLLGCAIKTSFSLLQSDKSQERRIDKLLGDALSKGRDHALHAASQLFGFHTGEIPDQIMDTLVSQFYRIDPANKGTIDNIDHGLAHFLKTDKAINAISILQDMLIAHADDLSLKSFGSVVTQIHNDKALLSTVSTRWLLRGEPVLCEGTYTIVSTGHGADMLLDIDPAELQPADYMHTIFLARKAIGYLFPNPESAASLLVSLMRHAPDKRTLTELGSLLFNPLLLNFTGKARTYVAECASGASGEVKEMLVGILKEVDDYLDALKSVGEIPELHPSEAQREAYNRRLSHQMAESFKEAEKQSVFLSLVSKSVLLYGRKSINYVHGPDGQSKRIEIPLQEHSVEIELPRQERLDRFGLDYMLRVFRAEQLHA